MKAKVEIWSVRQSCKKKDWVLLMPFFVCIFIAFYISETFIYNIHIYVYIMDWNFLLFMGEREGGTLGREYLENNGKIGWDFGWAVSKQLSWLIRRRIRNSSQIARIPMQVRLYTNLLHMNNTRESIFRGDSLVWGKQWISPAYFATYC